LAQFHTSFAPQQQHKHQQTNTNVKKPLEAVNMVHLSQIPSDASRDESLVKGMKTVKMNGIPAEDTFTTTVYGSRYVFRRFQGNAHPQAP
jgi:hypothetical protein